MTYQEIIDLANIYNDSYLNPQMQGSRAAALVYEAYLEFIKEKVADIEKTERITDDLMPVIRKKVFAEASTLSLVDVPDFYLTALLMGKFRDVCHPNPNAVIYRAIKHKPIANLSNNDPFEKPTNQFPTYYTYNAAQAPGVLNVLVVESDSAPLESALFYVMTPFKPTASNLTTTSPETLPVTHSEIAKILARKFTYTTEDQRYPYAENEIVQEQ